MEKCGGESDLMMNQRKAKADSWLEGCGEGLPADLQHPSILALIGMSLAEDLFPDDLRASSEALHTYDLTSAAILAQDRILRGRIFVKKAGVVAGLPIAAAVFCYLEPSIKIDFVSRDGSRVNAGDVLAHVEGPGGSLLAAERTALNFLGRLSGIASLTRQYVEAVAHTRAVILDTRKTAPGFRRLDKYAVRMGGAENHRMGLYDMVLIKNNHIDSAGGIDRAVERVRERYGDRYPIEVEVRTLEELATALALLPTRILLDNMDLGMMRRAVELAHGRVPLEASGNVNLETVRSIAETGVDYISAGSLTHSAPVLDVSMHVD